MSVIERRFSTGLPFLDRKIGGGLVPGRILAMTAPPTSQGELLLAELLTARRALLVSTTRTEAELDVWLDAHKAADDVRTLSSSPETLLETPSRVTDALSPESFLVLDPADDLEAADRDRYLQFLDHIKTTLRETDSIGILHCIDQERPPEQRSLTLHRADYVWQIETLVLSREIKTRLLVTKARRGRALTEPIPLQLTDQVRIDTSRRIA